MGMGEVGKLGRADAVGLGVVSRNFLPSQEVLDREPG